MKRFMLLIAGLLIFNMSAMQKNLENKNALLNEVLKLIDSYTDIEPAVTRLKLWFKIPGHEVLDNDPVFMEWVLNKLANKFVQQANEISILLPSDGSRLWQAIQEGRFAQQELAKSTINPNLSPQELIKKLINIYTNLPEAQIIKIIKDLPQFASLDLYNETPLTLAAGRNHPEVIKLLLSQGARVNKMNKNKRTPLSNAINNRNNEMVKILLSAGADPNIVVTFDYAQVTPLMLAAKVQGLRIINELLQAGARMNKQDINGNTVLMRAISNGARDEVFLELLKNSMAQDLEIKNKQGDNALLIAIKQKKRNDMVQELLNYGAKITPEALKAAQDLPNSVALKQAIIKTLEEKQMDPGLLFGASRIHQKL